VPMVMRASQVEAVAYTNPLFSSSDTKNVSDNGIQGVGQTPAWWAVSDLPKHFHFQYEVARRGLCAATPAMGPEGNI